MNITLTENSIMELLHTRVTHRPAIVLEGYHHLSITEQQQIDESYNAVYDLLMDQVIAEMSIGGAKAKLKGAVAGAKAGFQGDQNAGNVGKNTEIQSLFDDVKKNIGTIVAQHKNDLTKMGMSAEDPAMQKLASMEQAISSGGSGIEVKDNSAMAKAKQFGAEKVIPVVMKAVSPVMKKVEDLYNKSGPIKDFDTKYQQLVTQFTEKHPNMAEPISKFSEMAKKHKGKATFIIGGLTALLTATGALAAGGVGAFVIGVGLRGIYGVLAGEPPAKAFGKAAITAAVGKLVGGAFKDLFGDVDLSGAEETGVKAGVGELTGGEQVADMGPVAARNAALDALQDKYPDAGSFRELMELDPEAAQELQQQFARTGSSTSMNAAEDKIDLLMKGNELTDAGMDSGKFVGGELQLEPSAESALLDLDAKGLTMMHGDAQGNIKDLIAWSDEYTPTGSDFKGQMLADLKATDPEGFRKHLFHTMSQAKEKEMGNYFQQLTAAAKEAGVETADTQAMMELDPATYQAMELARVQKMELIAAYHEGDFSTHGHSARTMAKMWRDKYNAQFPDELAGNADDF